MKVSFDYCLVSACIHEYLRDNIHTTCSTPWSWSMFGKYEGLDYEECQREAAFDSFEKNTWWLHDNLALNNEDLADTYCKGISRIRTFKCK